MLFMGLFLHRGYFDFANASLNMTYRMSFRPATFMSIQPATSMSFRPKTAGRSGEIP